MTTATLNMSQVPNDLVSMEWACRITGLKPHQIRRRQNAPRPVRDRHNERTYLLRDVLTYAQSIGWPIEQVLEQYASYVTEQAERAKFDELYFTAAEACVVLGISRQTLGRWERAGYLTSVGTRFRKDRMFSKATIAAILEQRNQGADFA